MPIQFLKGDIFEHAGLHAFVLPSDASGAMDHGVAATFKKRWPDLAMAFRQAATSKALQVGEVFTWRNDVNAFYILILNESPEKKAKMASLVQATEKLFSIVRAAKDGKVGMVRLSTKDNALDPSRVKRILTDAAASGEAEVFVYEQFVRAPAN
jgi:O-acetyl-ADP-ribose deacetylase (regulator of RNase III)